MKTLKDFMNESVINEAKSNYYEDTLNALVDLIATAPEYDYDIDNPNMRPWVGDLLIALENDNNRLNEDSLNNKVNPAGEIKKLKNIIATLISEALNKSVSTDAKLR